MPCKSAHERETVQVYCYGGLTFPNRLEDNPTAYTSIHLHHQPVLNQPPFYQLVKSEHSDLNDGHGQLDNDMAGYRQFHVLK